MMKRGNLSEEILQTRVEMLMTSIIIKDKEIKKREMMKKRLSGKRGKQSVVARLFENQNQLILPRLSNSMPRYYRKTHLKRFVIQNSDARRHFL